MVLPDHIIEERCDPEQWKQPLISPFKQQHLQPSSVDLTLSRHFLTPLYGGDRSPIYLADLPGSDVQYSECMSDTFLLLPLHFVLGSTVETINVPPRLVAQIDGKSSLGRLGLSIHSTAGYVDAGFQGTITLEIFNANPRPIALESGLPICQISFTELAHPARYPYGHERLNSKYQGQRKTTESRYQG